MEFEFIPTNTFFNMSLCHQPSWVGLVVTRTNANIKKTWKEWVQTMIVTYSIFKIVHVSL